MRDTDMSVDRDEIHHKAKSTYCTYDRGCPMSSKDRVLTACPACLRFLKRNYERRIAWIGHKVG